MEDAAKYGQQHADMAEFAGMIARHLQGIYKTGFSEGLVNRILKLADQRHEAKPLWNEREMVLITYGNGIVMPDRKPLQILLDFLRERLAGKITCVHILPFFPYTSDDGFSVSDYMNVDPALGSWADITAIGAEFGLMTDLVINHVSASHPWFKNYLAGKDPGKDFFIESEPDTDYSQVVRPRSTPLFTGFESPRGTKKVWTTFSNDQVDLNFSNPEVLIEMIRILLFYVSKGVRIIRLDAIAFLWKERGTTCLHLPETHAIVKLLRDVVSYVSPGTIILTETNVPNTENWSYFGNADEAHMVYQFSLPPLLLHALFTGNSEHLNQWAGSIPELNANQTFLNYTASHDGIGIRPLEGLLPDREILQLLEAMSAFGGMVSYRSNPDGSQSPYEINITFLDAMKGDINGPDEFQEARFICSQTIMMSLKGIPAFYFNSLTGTANDHEGVRATGRARSINRKQWRADELVSLLSTDTMHSRIFKELIRLVGIRQGCSAFHPGSRQEVLPLGEQVVAFKRFNTATGDSIICISNLAVRQVDIQTSLVRIKNGYDLISCRNLQQQSDRIRINAFQTLWIAES
jgi:glycosidase